MRIFLHLVQWICILSALVALGAGTVNLSQATMGAGLIAAACLWAILGRIAQAGAHAVLLEEQMKLLRDHISKHEP